MIKRLTTTQDLDWFEILIQWCNHPVPSGEKLKDDTPEQQCRAVDWEILKKLEILKNVEQIKRIQRKFEVNSEWFWGPKDQV